MEFNNQSIGLILIVLAVIGEFLIPYSIAPFYKGYNHKKGVMSLLGNPKSPVRKIYNAWLILLGILLFLGSISIYQLYQEVSMPLSIGIIILVNIFGIGAGILAGIFSVDETKEHVTLASRIHGFGSALGFMTLLFVPVLIVMMMIRLEDMTGMFVSGISFVVATFFFVLFIMSDKSSYKNTFIDNEGVWQRLTLLFMYVPLLYIAIINLL